MKKYTFGIVFLIFFVFISPRLAHAQNILLNGGMEDPWYATGDPNYDNNPNSWTKWGSNNRMRETYTKISGCCSDKMSGGDGGHYQTMNVIVGATYNITGYSLRAYDLSADTIGVQFGSGSVAWYDLYGYDTNIGSWYNFNITTGAATASTMTFYVRGHNNPYAGNTSTPNDVYFENISVVKAADPATIPLTCTISGPTRMGTNSQDTFTATTGDSRVKTIEIYYNYGNTNLGSDYHKIATCHSFPCTATFDSSAVPAGTTPVWLLCNAYVSSSDDPLHDPANTPINTTNACTGNPNYTPVYTQQAGWSGCGNPSHMQVSLVSQITGTAGSCPIPGTTATLSWNGVPWATYYAVRAYDTAYGWNGQCNSSMLTGSTCTTDAASPFTFTSAQNQASLVGHTYGWWIHACDSNGCIEPVGGPVFTCTAAATPTIGGLTIEPDTSRGGVVGTTYGVSGLTSQSGQGGNNYFNTLAITQNINNGTNAALSGVALVSNTASPTNLSSLMTAADAGNGFVLLYARYAETVAGYSFAAGNYYAYYKGGWQQISLNNDQYYPTSSSPYELRITPKGGGPSGVPQFSVTFYKNMGGHTWKTYGYVYDYYYNTETATSERACGAGINVPTSQCY